MDELVRFQRDGAGEAFAADAADEDLLAGVGVGMAVQVLQQVEATAAHVAAVRLLSSVDDGVRLELRLLGETLAALRTLVRPLAGVRPRVALQTLPLTERSAADATAERLLACVDAVMRLQVALRREGFAARRAHEVFPRDALQNKLWPAGSFLLLEVRGHRLSSFNSSSWKKNTNFTDMENKHRGRKK